MPTPGQLLCDYASIVNDVAYSVFGLHATSDDVITDGIATDDQTQDILSCIAKGLAYVYNAHPWSFLRPTVSITTYPAYDTGTVDIDVSGNVTGTGTTFPAYSASALGRMYVPNQGTFSVGTYTSGTVLVLDDYTGDAVTGSIYSIGFDTYPMPSGAVAIEGRLTYPEYDLSGQGSVRKVDEVEIRRRLADTAHVGRPAIYAETTKTFDPTAGSAKTVSFFPIPDDEYVLTGIGIASQYMIDSTNKYPLGADVLGPCIVESCLAAAEREIMNRDASHPDGVHSRNLPQLLAMAIKRDTERTSPDTLGVDRAGMGDSLSDVPVRRSSGIYWDAGGYTGWL